MRVLTAEEMREVDRRAIEELGIPGPVLMENAAVGVVDALAAQFPDARRVVVLAGPGNNGGDGLAVARHLDGRRYDCRSVLVLGRKPLAGDAALQHDILERAGMAPLVLGPDDGPAPVLEACRSADLVVDALFGTGLGRPLAGHFAALVEGLATVDTPILAVDLPSGLDGSSWSVPGPHLRAVSTVTFAAPKVAHLLPPASEAVGELVVTDLGLPSGWVASAPGDLHLLESDELAGYLLPRPRTGHKGTFGHALVVAGGPGTSGAAVLAARGTLRGGAGLVTVAVPALLRETVDAGARESMTVGVGGAGAGRLDDTDLAGLGPLVEGKAALGVGPGLGLATATVATVRALCAQAALPLVLDADGLNAFAGDASALAGRRAPTLLTPHPGELGRLLGIGTEVVERDRLAAVRRAARVTGAVVVLKGHRSLIAAPEGGVWINPTGNPGMATGGAGDVLTGLATALLAQGYDVLAAAHLAVYLHGLAGDLAAAEVGETALVAGDLVRALPAAWRALEDG